ncbi:peptidyl-prolyl cis-trans isomerase [Ruegeria profundi]|uniref:peptidylprolyl isomerase n=1 Tax=Ruegeria profundi TaxID=1685378 RepID=UPI001CD7FC80|nr:peptidylprolyl isomerase [Ruegeria profundi]MCA0930442.1 peptidyl-prolyl cis-trans isomerase [Ruegeria profundi]
MRILKEPLLHFVLIGAAIFGWFSLVGQTGETPDRSETIVIDNGEVDLLAARFETTWKRAPRNDELQALIDARIREEVLVREARKLGLDRGDQIVRARLAQKMNFLFDGIASSVVPEDDALNTYLAENAARFTVPAQIAFDQIFLGAQPVSDEIDRAFSELQAGEDWPEIGLRSLMPSSLPLSASSAIDGTFGQGFSNTLFMLEPREWVGPIQSGYGQHLVRITETRPQVLPPLNEIREEVLAAWRRDTAQELAEAQYESLAAQYRIQTPDPQE